MGRRTLLLAPLLAAIFLGAVVRLADAPGNSADLEYAATPAPPAPLSVGVAHTAKPSTMQEQLDRCAGPVAVRFHQVRPTLLAEHDFCGGLWILRLVPGEVIRLAGGGIGGSYQVTDRIKVVECDFREIPGQYDKLLSIGTLEHAGRDQLRDVVRAHAAALKPGGLGVIHFIGHVGSFDTEFYIRKYIFPGGWIPSLHEAIDAMDECGLEVLDVENLRRHYALTLDEWAARFDASWDAIHALDPVRFDERHRRIWRTYLWSCAEMFRSRTSRTHLFQVTVSKGNVTNYPMSRAFLYRQDS